MGTRHEDVWEVGRSGPRVPACLSETCHSGKVSFILCIMVLWESQGSAGKARLWGWGRVLGS